MRAIREILSSDQIAENPDKTLLQSGSDPCFPDPLKDLLQLMGSNIEEPLAIDELASYAANVSRRRVERLFQSHLDSSPSRDYLELCITTLGACCYKALTPSPAVLSARPISATALKTISIYHRAKPGNSDRAETLTPLTTYN